MSSGPEPIHCPSCGGALDPEARPCPQCGTTVAARRCGVCFTMCLAGDVSCRHCGDRLPEEQTDTRPDDVSCPGCGAPMTPRRLGNTLFDECDHCGGLWLCPATADSVGSEAQTRSRLRGFDRAVTARPASPAAPVAYRKCPRCGKLMNRASYAAGSGVVLDVCRRHGSYFDRGELTRIFQFIEGGGLERARRREAETLREDVRDLRRKAITARAGDTSLPLSLETPRRSFTALDLLHWIAGHLTS